MSENLPGGYVKTFGLYHEGEQIGFQCFAEYTPWKDKSKPRIVHSNRTVIHPDYCGLGLGIRLITLTSHMMHATNHRVMAKFSSAPVAASMLKDPCWKLAEVKRALKVVVGGNMLRRSGFREQVKTYSFNFTPNPDVLREVDATAQSLGMLR